MVIDEAKQDGSPWHEGERAVQRLVGVAEQIDPIGRRNIRSFMPDQHREFFAGLPFLVAGSVDKEGRPWASILSGPPGFAVSLDPRRLRIAAQPAAGDPLREALGLGAMLGLLGIELSTRRRNRVNGPIVEWDRDGFTVAVAQSFGNCPSYIQRRDCIGRDEKVRAHAEPLSGLDDAARELILRADTCFVASAAPAGRSVDVSHRGGRPGFVRIAGDGAIVVPDYRGNRYFNTLGNLRINPRAGLLFIDFANGDLLQLTGTTEIVWSGPEVRALMGAERLWRLVPTRGNRLRGGFPLRMQFRDFSPMSLATGTWAEAGTEIGAG
ncbi:MAG TPA: pyridoxamine 5'-phosphate oxidase family protein [Stellaceae bacterium]|nr:pyridoxamine 5'-phosphate oxidase family protein [Stellaceae bacterium]